jgi:hypothetical protein
VLSLQIFLMAISIPLMLLAALVEERRQAEESLKQTEARMAFAAASTDTGLWQYDVHIIWRLIFFSTQSLMKLKHSLECLSKQSNSARLPQGCWHQKFLDEVPVDRNRPGSIPPRTLVPLRHRRGLENALDSLSACAVAARPPGSKRGEECGQRHR